MADPRETGIRVSASFPAAVGHTHWDWSSSNPALPLRGLTRERLWALDAGPHVASSACCCPLDPFGRRSADRFTRLLPAGSGTPDRTRQTFATAHPFARRHRRALQGYIWPSVYWIVFHAAAPCTLLNDCHPRPVNSHGIRKDRSRESQRLSRDLIVLALFLQEGVPHAFLARCQAGSVGSSRVPFVAPWATSGPFVGHAGPIPVLGLPAPCASSADQPVRPAALERSLERWPANPFDWPRSSAACFQGALPGRIDAWVGHIAVRRT
jgi:hypothetical protein